MQKIQRASCSDQQAPSDTRRPEAQVRPSASAPSAISAGTGLCNRQIRDQLEAWVNEGGAGDDVLS